WGSAIFTFSGAKNFNFDQKVPLTRFFIHHNKAVNVMLATNDWGGIAYWQGGSYYTYNNISGNVIGHKAAVPLENDWKTVAYNYYLDGTFKSYTFNNIAWSKYNSTDSPYRGRGGYFVVLGFMNHLFNNSFYHFRHGILGSSGNRSSFLGNIVSDITGDFIQQNRPGDTSLRGGGDTGEQGTRGMPTNAYGHNVFFGEDNPAGNARGVRGNSIEDWREGLAGINARLTHTGWKVPGSAFDEPDPYGAHDFRPKADAPVDGRGVKFFVPFGLYKMVSEWNFIHHPGNENLVLGEHFYMDEAFRHRHMYEDVPRNDLAVHGATADSYVDGELEDWQKGALRFDGEGVHAVLKHEDIVEDFEYKQPLTERGQPGRRSERGTWTEPRETLDMDDNSCLIEAHLRLPNNATGGALVSKAAGGRGYEIGIDAQGQIGLLLAGDNRATAVSASSVSDGQWHHVIAEVDRRADAVRFYLDGRLDSETPLSLEGSLANRGDFFVGRGVAGFLAGDLDFLRVSRGTLSDAKTTIEELHAWQFEGPFMRDWTGEFPADGDRDAGAVEK
ncbi:MAG: LamG domain-containing protein, partial [Opitutales bacterium]